MENKGGGGGGGGVGVGEQVVGGGGWWTGGGDMKAIDAHRIVLILWTHTLSDALLAFRCIILAVN